MEGSMCTLGWHGWNLPVDVLVISEPCTRALKQRHLFLKFKEEKTHISCLSKSIISTWARGRLAKGVGNWYLNSHRAGIQNILGLSCRLRMQWEGLAHVWWCVYGGGE